MASNKMRNYISYAINLMTEKGHTSVQLKAMGRAINKTVAIGMHAQLHPAEPDELIHSHLAAEIIKRRVKDLHQLTEVGSVNITDTWEPKEEGLNRLEITRHVSIITITLSKDVLDTTHPGYQAPLDEELVKAPQDEELLRRPRNRRPRRGGRCAPCCPHVGAVGWLRVAATYVTPVPWSPPAHIAKGSVPRITSTQP
jgi:ribonucleases P/MRP protein subunit RPP25